jgi:hypothetical protein
MRVTDPSGRQWVVRRRLIARSPRLGKVTPDGSDWPAAATVGGMSSGGLGSFLVGLVAVVVVVVAGAFLLSGLLFLIQIVVLLLFLPVSLLLRVLHLQPWVVRASTTSGPRVRHRESVVGWRESGERMREIALRLASGAAPTAWRVNA